MNKLLLIAIILIRISLHAQTQVERNLVSPKAGTVNLAETVDLWESSLYFIKEQPKPASDIGNKKEELKKLQAVFNKPNARSGERLYAPKPILENNFTANTAQGTPNDNHVAISNDGKIVSVVNTNMRVYDENGTQLQSKTLTQFSFGLGVFTVISDPRVIYDPVEDRFILMYFVGTNSTATRIIIGFSQTNDPTGTWNLYALSGNPLNDSTWSDYPIISLTDKDFFITFNHLRDGQSWQAGFRYSAIWQIDKARGFDGDTLQYNFWHHIEHNGKPVWSVCPIQPGLFPTPTQSYFLSVRPSDLNNDTVFLHTITDSYASGNAQLNTKVLTTDVAYGLPPNARQRDNQFLATNDARVLSGMIQNNKIQYVQNTIDPNTLKAGIYYGVIDNPGSTSPTIKGRIISYDSVELGYPSIAYMGNNEFDNRSIITCSITNMDTFPGTCAIYVDANGNYSEPLVVKYGSKAVNLLLDSTERWGDYTGIQRKYNEPNTAWLAGSFGNQTYGTWIAKVVNADSGTVSSINSYTKPAVLNAFPNPAVERIEFELETPANNYLRIAVVDAAGKEIALLYQDYLKTGLAKLSFNTGHLQQGLYFVQVSNHGKPYITKQFAVIK